MNFRLEVIRMVRVEVRMVVHRLAVVVLSFLLISSSNVLAQAPTPTVPTPPAPSRDRSLSAQELEALVAPIALYPDSLLSIVVMASTYPLEIVQADRWIKANTKLKGDELQSAIDKQAWDDSVKSLAAAPDVLSMMSTNLEWTLKLGDAVLAQQADVMDAIQRLRLKAEANNKLPTTKQQRVTKTEQQGRQIIAIEQTDPETLYVPYYDPGVVYGAWPYASYPPYYFGYPGYIAGGVIAAGLAFGAGWGLARWASGGNYWGGGFNWNGNNININRPRVNPLAGGNWQHRPEHRHGVRYGNSNVRDKFGNNIRGGVQDRMDFRGRAGAGIGAGVGAGIGAGIGAGHWRATWRRTTSRQPPQRRTAAFAKA